MSLTSQDTIQRTVSDPLYDAPEASNVALGVPNVNYNPNSGSFITVTNGAGANAPSEEAGYYFGGLYSENGTAFNYFTQPKDQSPYLVTVTMTDLGHAVWSRVELPDNVWRAEAGLVWIPTSTNGILIAIGGVTKPADVNLMTPQDNTTLSETFLKEFPIFDIGTQKWYTQAIDPASPFPPTPLAQFCTVVATDPTDTSHHEIYIYGGWDSNGGTGIKRRLDSECAFIYLDPGKPCRPRGRCKNEPRLCLSISRPDDRYRRHGGVGSSSNLQHDCGRLQPQHSHLDWDLRSHSP